MAINKKYFIGVLLLIIVGGLWLSMRDMESFISLSEATLSEATLSEASLSEASVSGVSLSGANYLASDHQTITLYDKNALNNSIGDYDVNSLSNDIINNNHTKEISWNDIYVSKDSTKKNQLNVIPKPKPSLILSDSCSKKGFLNSDFKEDICVKYSGNKITINEKCQQLSADNCIIPNCCVLLENNKCVSGDANGPTYSTENGNTIDYSYYYYKAQCYGDC